MDIATTIATKTDAEILRDFREDLNINPETAASLFGKSERQWYRYESGENRFPKKNWRYVVVLLQVYGQLREEIDE